MLEVIFYILFVTFGVVQFYCILCLFLSVLRLRKVRILHRISLRWYFSLGLFIFTIFLGFQTRLLYDRFIELEPKVDRQQIIGEWEKSNSSLYLSVDDNFNATIKGHYQNLDSGKGVWELSGNQLFLNYNDGTVKVCRIILFNKEIRIIKELDDADEDWINDMGFKVADK